MNNVLYRKPLRAFDARKDIDSAPFVFATQENNFFHVWTMDDHEGTNHHGFYYTKEQAIDAASDISKKVSQ